MARPGMTREQVFEVADALVREGQSPTVVAVRTRLGGGSPNTINPLLGPKPTFVSPSAVSQRRLAPVTSQCGVTWFR